MSGNYVIIFEDEHSHRFYPISLSRPVYHILAGARTNYDRIRSNFPDCRILNVCRPELSNLFNGCSTADLMDLASRGATKIILINGATIITKNDQEFISSLESESGFFTYTDGEELIAASIPMGSFRDLIDGISQIHTSGESARIIQASGSTHSITIKKISNLWDIVLNNPQMLISDFEEYYEGKPATNAIGDSYLYGKQHMVADKDVVGDFGSVIDARNGPIMMGTGVRIKPFSYIEGPAFIGKGCHLVGGKVTGGCSFGTGCRIGGEVENTIMAGNSNKYHEGFLGHTYLGEWVNLGALTTNSDLKNNYGEISVRQDGKDINTECIKIGSFIGDHTKTGIGITLNTGIVIGFGCNLFGGTLIAEKEIPSFAWGNDTLRHEYALQRSMETARTVMNRRNYEFDENQRQLFGHLFIRTRNLRERWLHAKRHQG